MRSDERNRDETRLRSRSARSLARAVFSGNDHLVRPLPLAG